jgi:hypothetical protein
MVFGEAVREQGVTSVLERAWRFVVEHRPSSLPVCEEDSVVSLTPAARRWPAALEAIEALVAAGRGLYLLSGGRVRKLARGRFYGLTRDEEAYYAFCSHPRGARGSIYRLGLDAGRISGSRRLFSGLTRGVHQIDIVDDRLLVLDSYRNEIVVLDRRGRVQRRLHPLGRLRSGRDSENYAHLNSVQAVGDRVYVLAHNETYKTGRRSEILVLDRERLTVRDRIPDVAGCGHNVVARDGLFLVCDSLGGTVTNHGLVVFKPSTFTRGVAVNDDLVLVGGSVYSDRGTRLSSDVFVYALDRQFAHLGTLTIKDAGQLHEIRLLGTDYGMSDRAGPVPGGRAL